MNYKKYCIVQILSVLLLIYLGSELYRLVNEKQDLISEVNSYTVEEKVEYMSVVALLEDKLLAEEYEVVNEGNLYKVSIKQEDYINNINDLLKVLYVEETLLKLENFKLKYLDADIYSLELELLLR